MVITIKELEELYGQGKYREIVSALEGLKLDPRPLSGEAPMLLRLAWAHHQLGDYQKSMVIFEELSMRHTLPETAGERDVLESALRGVVHGLIQTNGDFARVELIMGDLPPSLESDNVYLNAVLGRARKGEAIKPENVVWRIMATLDAVPYKTVSGHIVSNGAFALHNAAGQDEVKPYLPILPGLIFVAIRIYNVTGAAKNHLAGAAYRASLICESAGWLKFALIEAQTSHGLWTELAGSEGGDRYYSKLMEVQTHLMKLEGMMKKSN
ncbi:MAG: hypothetical protein HY443_01680 [Candidatus Nealsonbacteria bacterium]|nr:hypothetical protein [Candidatus Nealsonbacteria bacterium]